MHMRYLLQILITASVFAGLPAGAHEIPVPVTYIYGYNNNLVIGSVINGNKDQVAFTSFESNDKGFWTYAGAPAGNATDPGRTGDQYYNLGNGNIERTGLQAGKYILSYWVKGGNATVGGTGFTQVSQVVDMTINGWTCYQYVVNIGAGGSVQLSGNTKIDELRLYPFDAQMTTFTFDPLIGKTSETDANNRTTFFEYDEFNRLKCTRDQYGNIRQQYIYHFKNQS